MTVKIRLVTETLRGIQSRRLFLAHRVGRGRGAVWHPHRAGGGFVLMPVLLLLYPKVAPEHLTAISLAVVFFNAASGSESYAFMKRIDYNPG